MAPATADRHTQSGCTASAESRRTGASTGVDMKQPGRLATAALSAAVLLAACSGLEPKDFSAVAPVFEPDRFFDGPIHAWGVQENGGLPTRSFTAELSSSREGDTL